MESCYGSNSSRESEETTSQMVKAKYDQLGSDLPKLCADGSDVRGQDTYGLPCDM